MNARFSERLCLKILKWTGIEEDAGHHPLASMYTCTHIYTNIQHTHILKINQDKTHRLWIGKKRLLFRNKVMYGTKS